MGRSKSLHLMKYIATHLQYQWTTWAALSLLQFRWDAAAEPA